MTSIQPRRAARRRRDLPAAGAVPAPDASPRTSRSRSSRAACWRRVDWTARRAARRASCSTGRRRDRSRSGSSATLSMPEQQLVEIAKALGADARDRDHGRADRVADAARGRAPVRRHRRAAGAGRRHHLHLAPARGAVRDRRPRHRAARRRERRPRAARRGQHATEAHPADGRPRAVAICSEARSAAGDVVLEVRQSVECARSALRDVSLQVRAGEILGLAGLVGSGRTELAETLFGLTPATAARSWCAGRPVPSRRRGDAIRLGIAYVPEDRRQHGVVAEMSVAANITLASLAAVSRRGIDRPLRRANVGGAALRRSPAHQDAWRVDARSGRSRAAISRRSRWRAGWRPSRAC